MLYLMLLWLLPLGATFGFLFCLISFVLEDNTRFAALFFGFGLNSISSQSLLWQLTFLAYRGGSRPNADPRGHIGLAM